MATKRKPATAVEVMEYFEKADLAAATMLHGLAARTLKQRSGPAPVARSRRTPAREGTASATVSPLPTAAG